MPPFALFSCFMLAAADSRELEVAAAGGARELQVGTLELRIPLAGSLGPISGTVRGLLHPETYKFCVYLRSTASGGDLFNGPKPQESDGSNSPIQPDGTFLFVDWWANAVYDPSSPWVYGFVYPNTLGNCLPVLGEVNMPLPPLMFTLSSAWAVLPRANTIALSIVSAPGIGESANVLIRVTGLPEAAAAYALWWWFSADGLVLTGPVPSCAGGERGVALVGGAAAGTATATLLYDAELQRADARYLTVARKRRHAPLAAPLAAATQRP